MENKIFLVNKIEYYIGHGYMENPDDSHDDPYSEAESALIELSKLDAELCKKYCKIIMSTLDIRDNHFDATCYSLLFDIDREYSLMYLNKHVGDLSYPMLTSAMYGLCQYSNTPFRKEFSGSLIAKIKKTL